MFNPANGRGGKHLDARYRASDVVPHALEPPKIDAQRMAELEADIKAGKGKWTSSSHAPTPWRMTLDEVAARMREKYGKRAKAAKEGE